MTDAVHTTATPEDQADAGQTVQPQFLRFVPERGADEETLLDAFLEACMDADIELYAHQEEAVLEVMANKHVIVNTPTGSGKSLIATALAFKALSEGGRCYYTCPIKALVSEKFFQFAGLFGAENVGMATGDASINGDAPIVCCTAEILSNLALREGENAAIDAVVMDEFHYYSDPERGIAWQLPLLTLPQTTFMLMSATLGDTTQIEDALNLLNDKGVAVVKSAERPVPLNFTYSETPIHEEIGDLVSSNKFPVYVVNFTQREASEQAQNLTSVNLCTKEEKKAIAEELKGFQFDSAYGKDVRRFVSAGVGVHHAGLLPKYRLLNERLAQKGLLKVISGTDTLGVGVNVPIRTVLFSKLCKYNGERVKVLSVRDFHQIAGRAGRKGFDDEGWVVCQAPEHVIENKRAEQRFAKDNKKKRKIVKKKAPERNFVMWDEATYTRLQNSEPEPLRSSFDVSHGFVLGVLQGVSGTPKNGRERVHELIDLCHETDHKKAKLHEKADLLVDSLIEAGLVTVVNNVKTGQRLVIDAELQKDFSLNHTLALYVLQTLPKLNPESETYALDILSMLESMLESPRLILAKQVDAKKRALLAELKAQDVPYDERMDRLEDVTYDKPLGDFIYSTFNEFSNKHPWVGADNIRPKSIAREMIERFMSFGDFIRDYDLRRSEGLLLRYLSQTYKALVQTVPDGMKTEALFDIIAFFRTLIAEVDSSLITEWEAMLSGDGDAEKDETRPKGGPLFLFDPKTNPRGFRAKVRAEVHRVVKALSEQDYALLPTLFRTPEDAVGTGGAAAGAWTERTFRQTMKPFFDEHEALLFDHTARQPSNTLLEETGPSTYRVRQILVDPEGHNEWYFEGHIALDPPPGDDEPWLQLVALGQ